MSRRPAGLHLTLRLRPDFLIIAFVVFMMVRAINSLKKKEEAAVPAAPPKPSEEVVLLREIRDGLKGGS